MFVLTLDFENNALKTVTFREQFGSYRNARDRIDKVMKHFRDMHVRAYIYDRRLQKTVWFQYTKKGIK